MYPRRAWRVRLTERRDLIRNTRWFGQPRQAWPCHQHAQEGPRFMHVHTRLGAECHRRGVRETIDQPALAEIVVDDEDAIRVEPIADIPEGLLGEHVAFEPHAGKAGLHRQRVDQCEHHEVVMLRRRPQKMTRVVVYDRDPWIRIRMIGMMLAAEAND